MIEFVKCELFIFLNLLGLLLGSTLIVKVIGAESYLKMLFLGSIIAIVAFLLIFIFKFIRFLITDDSSKYICNEGNTMKKALNWLSNIV